jgi:NAD(P)H dehydrogenase (quinone)
LYGKFAGVFFSTSSQASGQETTALSCIPFFAHHGINFVPIGYKCGKLGKHLIDIFLY